MAFNIYNEWWKYIQWEKGLFSFASATANPAGSIVDRLEFGEREMKYSDKLILIGKHFNYSVASLI